MRLKICFISPSAYPLFNPKCKATFGGAEVDTYLIAKELSKDKRFSIIFVTADFGQKSKEIYGNIAVFRGHNLRKNKITSAIKLSVLLKKIDADVYFQESANAGTGLVRFVSKLKNKKFVYRTASEMDCTGEFIKKKAIEGIFFKYGIRKADKVITQNKINQSQLIESLQIDSVVIKNATDIGERFLGKKDYILWVARSAELKKPSLFLELAKSFSKEKFVMICPPANENGDKTIPLNARKIKNLRFINSVPYEKVDPYFQKAKIFVNTSDYEGFPNTFVQAAKNATPILSLNVNPDKFLDKYKCGFCANGDFEKMKKQLNRLLNDEELRKKMGENAYNYAKNNHDIKKIIKQYKQVFIQVANDKKSL